jgi:hypothetical protein
MIILDTNIVSEMMKPAPEHAVELWLDEQPAGTVFLSAITEAELRLGLAIMPDGQRRKALTVMIEGMMAEEFGGRIFSFDSRAAIEFAAIAAQRRQSGRPISISDAQIAAIARARGATLATRNMTDFAGCGIEIVNPWSAMDPTSSAGAARPRSGPG